MENAHQFLYHLLVDLNNLPEEDFKGANRDKFLEATKTVSDTLIIALFIKGKLNFKITDIEALKIAIKSKGEMNIMLQHLNLIINNTTSLN